MVSNRRDFPTSLQDYNGFVKLPNQSSSYSAAVVVILTEDAEKAYSEDVVFQEALRALTEMDPEREGNDDKSFIESREICYVVLRGLRSSKTEPGSGTRIKDSPSVWIFDDQRIRKQHLPKCRSIAKGCCGHDNIHEVFGDAVAVNDILAQNFSLKRSRCDGHSFLCNTMDTISRDMMISDNDENQTKANVNQAELFFSSDDWWRPEKGRGRSLPIDSMDKATLEQEVWAGIILYQPKSADADRRIDYFDTRHDQDKTIRYYSAELPPDVLRRGRQSALDSKEENQDQTGVVQEPICLALVRRFYDKSEAQGLLSVFMGNPKFMQETWESSEQGQIASLFPAMLNRGSQILEEDVLSSRSSEKGSDGSASEPDRSSAGTVSITKPTLAKLRGIFKSKRKGSDQSDVELASNLGKPQSVAGRSTSDTRSIGPVFTPLLISTEETTSGGGRSEYLSRLSSRRWRRKRG